MGRWHPLRQPTISGSGDTASHATGGTVDVTLTYPAVDSIEPGYSFDEFSHQAHARSLETVADSDPLALSRDLRRLLRAVMFKAGFVQVGLRVVALRERNPTLGCRQRKGSALSGDFAVLKARTK